jgi:hypothetical protein
MTQTIWHVTMSLDGFIAGADDTLDWRSGTITFSGSPVAW